MYRYLVLLFLTVSFYACTEEITQVVDCKVEITRSSDGKILSRKILSCQTGTTQTENKAKDNTQSTYSGPRFGKHTAFGFPQGHSPSNKVITREIYVLSNNSKTKFADWVAYKVTPSTIGRSKKRVWRADPELQDEDTLEPEDYRGANRVLKTDRGHQVPLASFSATKYWYETNYLSNITPQFSSLNQGPWVKLESKVRELAKKHDAVYVLSGPVYTKNMPALPGADEPHQVPSGYWKIIIVKSDDNKLGYRMSAFLFPQEAERKQHFCEFQSTVSDISKNSGLKFPHIENYRQSLAQNPYLLCNN